MNFSHSDCFHASHHPEKSFPSGLNSSNCSQKEDSLYLSGERQPDQSLFRENDILREMLNQKQQQLVQAHHLNQQLQIQVLNLNCKVDELDAEIRRMGIILRKHQDKLLAKEKMHNLQLLGCLDCVPESPSCKEQLIQQCQSGRAKLAESQNQVNRQLNLIKRASLDIFRWELTLAPFSKTRVFSQGIQTFTPQSRFTDHEAKSTIDGTIISAIGLLLTITLLLEN